MRETRGEGEPPGIGGGGKESQAEAAAPREGAVQVAGRCAGGRAPAPPWGLRRGRQQRAAPRARVRRHPPGQGRGAEPCRGAARSRRVRRGAPGRGPDPAAPPRLHRTRRRFWGGIFYLWGGSAPTAEGLPMPALFL